MNRARAFLPFLAATVFHFIVAVALFFGAATRRGRIVVAGALPANQPGPNLKISPLETVPLEGS